MKRKANARWQGTGEGRRRYAVDAERHAQRHAVLVQGALRRRQGHQSRGAHRRGATPAASRWRCRSRSNNAGFTADAHRHRSAAHARPGQRQLRPITAHPPHDARARAGASTPRSSRDRRGAKANCPVSKAAERHDHAGRDARELNAGQAMAARRAPPIKGRGATFNPRNRYRRDEREAFDDGWRAPTIRTTTRRRRRRARSSRSSRRARSSRTTTRPTFRSRSRSTRTRAASTAASTATRGPRTRTSTCRRASTSRRSSSPSRTRRRCCAKELAKPGYRLRPDRARHQHRPVPADRARVEGDALDPRSARRVRASVHDRHQVGAGRARHRPHRADGGEEHGARRRVDHHARPRARAQARAARRRAAAAAAGAAALADAGIPVGVMTAPMIPQLNDRDLEAILEAAAAHGATTAGWVMLRLPLEVAPLFRDWLDDALPAARRARDEPHPAAARRPRLRSASSARACAAAASSPTLIEKRFELACRRLGLNGRERARRGSLALPAAARRAATAALARARDERQAELFD